MTQLFVPSRKKNGCRLCNASECVRRPLVVVIVDLEQMYSSVGKV